VCDTFVTRTDDGMVFAKNSDRDVNEAQLWEWTPAAEHAPEDDARVTRVSVPQVPGTHATLVSRPWWMWGAEMGANSLGVVIGNEAVFTTERTSLEPGLLGMDLLRLALERAATADEAVEVIVALLDEHGQSGSCSVEHRRFTYHNSFLVADPQHAIVLETAGRHWASEEVTGRARSISNGLTIPGFAERFADRTRTRVSRCAVRRGLTQRRAEASHGVLDAARILRDNGTGGGPRWSPVTGSMGGPNMHAGGLVASSQTVGSWISDLASGTHWATGTAEPAFSLFVPLRVDRPLDETAYPTEAVDNTADDRSRWWRHERLHRLALRDWVAAEAAVAEERDRVQAEWLEEPPESDAALRAADDLDERWLQRLRTSVHADTRPWWLRRRWASFDRQAGMHSGS
jgi:dipeptidase